MKGVTVNDEQVNVCYLVILTEAKVILTDHQVTAVWVEVTEGGGI